MKTLREKRQELNIIIDNINNLEFVELNNLQDRTKLINTIKFLIKKQNEEFIKEVLDEIFKNAVIVKEIDLNRKLIYVDLVEEIIKQNSGFEE